MHPSPDSITPAQPNPPHSGAGPTGIEVARRFHDEIVGPLIGRHLPGLPYAAARLGSGSDVLGLDDAMSRDHDWGCRLTLLVDHTERAAIPHIVEVLESELPERYRGLPVRFATTWSPTDSHNVEVATASDFVASRLGTTITSQPTVLDWLTVTGQGVLEVTAGPLFRDDTTEISTIRRSLDWYPNDIEKYVLAAGWQRIAQQFPQVGRTAQRGQLLQSRLLAARIAEDVIYLGFLLHRQWAPFSKWRESAFCDLSEADRILPHLTDAVDSHGWEEREQALATALRILLQIQRERDLPTPREGITQFWNRPYLTIDPAVPELLLEAVTDTSVARLPAGVGSLEQWVDSAEVLAHPERRSGAIAAYRAWIG